MAEVRNQSNPQTPETAGQNPSRTEPSTQSVEPYRRSSELSQGGWGSSPFSFMGRFMSDMDRLFDEFGFGSSPMRGYGRRGEGMNRPSWIPKVDVFERGGQLIVHADLPGLKQEDVHVNVDQGVLTLSGERSHTHEHEKGGVYRCERSYGSFERSIVLPDGVDPAAIKASFESGVLEVTIPLPKETRSAGRNIPIGGKTESTGIKH